MPKLIIRITTVPSSLGGLLKGQLNFMSNYYNVLGIASPGNNNELKNIEKVEGITTVPVEMTRKITPIKDTIAVYQLYKIFKREKPFIVHSHTPKAGTLAMIAAKLSGTPHRLHTIAGLPLVEATGVKRTVLNAVETLTYSCATKIYPNSYGLENIILDNKFTTKSKLKVIANGSSNGIDIDIFNPDLIDTAEKQKLKSELGILDTDYVYIFLGRIVTDKGVNELVRAFDKISKKESSVKLLLVGRYENDLDPLHKDTLALIESNNQIISTGHVTDVRPYFAISNVLTFPSYREGFPNVVMQAGAMGIPAIVSDINGCNEIISEDKNGSIIPVKNTEALYQKMLQIFEGKLIYNKGVCRDMIVSNYNKHVVWDALLSEYKSLN
ncbi:glycosyltransferase family 4 protein [Tamlana agarivorans]|uniref:Glycosyltransferase family 4 protein n=1 Tax=Pseudotamlana agarivorans TaxID=481183 RepID=A0ACC5UCF9_9FLAO|nr:glycosyltransferase family 4 protein [Tamlana agarivorans]MBU2951995.1 glycosyltransferase family 4 protein [Tamlana agarivorans]